MNPTTQEQPIFERLNRLVVDYRSRKNQGKFVDFHDPTSLSRLLEPEKSEASGDWDVIFSWVEKYLEYSVNTAHPNFVNRMWSGANLPSIVGEIISAITNTSACTYESAPVSTVLEKYMIQQMLDLVGFKNGEGQMTTGSSNANMIAMMAARDNVNRKIKQKGLSVERQLFAFVGADSHYSMDKAAAILGIGTDNLVKIPLDENGRMRTDALSESIQKTVDKGGIPFFVASTAGTTVRGSYDRLVPLREMRDKFGFWLHVDGAWGGAAVLSPKLRRIFLADIEKVDSFTFDFHKMPGTNLICNVLLLNEHPGALRQSCSIGDSSYIFRPESEKEEFNLGAFSLQCGRRVDSLKWFLDWKFYGQKGFSERIERYLELSKYAEQIVQQSQELEMVVPRESFNVCFRFKVPLGIPANDFNLKLRSRLLQDGKFLVGFGYIGQELCLRLLITDPEYNFKAVKLFFQGVIETSQLILEEV